jgi:hypothetical protein
MDIDAFVRLIDESGLPAPGPQAVTAFEAATGLTLPNDYRAFLAKTPGGRLSKTVNFSLSGEEDGAEYLGRVAGLRTEYAYSLEERVRTAAESAIPEGLLSIMTDRGGNALALAVRPDRLGQIFFLITRFPTKEDRRSRKPNPPTGDTLSGSRRRSAR